MIPVSYSVFMLILVIKKGDEGDCMYIIFSGEIGIYTGVNDFEDKCAAILKDNKVFGERAMETDENRVATVIAHAKTICLMLLKKDLKEIIYVDFHFQFTF